MATLVSLSTSSTSTNDSFILSIRPLGFRARLNGYPDPNECLVTKDEIDTLGEEFRSLLSFYSSELQSHGALIAGFAVVIFAAAQALSPLIKQQFQGVVFFSIFAGILASAVIHSTVRLIAYGKLATAMTGGDIATYRQAKCRYLSQRNMETSKQFDTLFPLAKASTFAGDYFYNQSEGLSFVPAIYNRTSRVRRVILPFPFFWSALLTYWLIEGSPDFTVGMVPIFPSLIVLLSLATLGLIVGLLLSAQDSQTEERHTRSLLAHVSPKQKSDNSQVVSKLDGRQVGLLSYYESFEQKLSR